MRETRDLITLPLTVRRMQALEAAATYGTSTSNEASESILFPENIRTDTGRVSIVVLTQCRGRPGRCIRVSA